MKNYYPSISVSTSIVDNQTQVELTTNLRLKNSSDQWVVIKWTASSRINDGDTLPQLNDLYEHLIRSVENSRRDVDPDILDLDPNQED